MLKRPLSLGLLLLCVALTPVATGARDRTSDDHAQAPTPQGKLAGRYRLVLEGFTVGSTTWDHALQVDGKGDEVFLSANVMYVDREGTPLLADEISSRTLGDINGYTARVAAGRANGVGGAGGLLDGDSYPAEPPYVRTMQPNPARRYPPWVLWEGNLVQGDDALVVAPTIWEWDGGRDAFGDWSAWLPTPVKKIGDEVKKYTKGGTIADLIIESVQAGLGIASSMYEGGLLGQAQDRPIGMKEASPATDPRTFVFAPKLLVLNYDRAEALLKTSLLGVPGSERSSTEMTRDSRVTHAPRWPASTSTEEGERGSSANTGGFASAMQRRRRQGPDSPRGDRPDERNSHVSSSHAPRDRRSRRNYCGERLRRHVSTHRLHPDRPPAERTDHACRDSTRIPRRRGAPAGKTERPDSSGGSRGP